MTLSALLTHHETLDCLPLDFFYFIFTNFCPILERERERERNNPTMTIKKEGKNVGGIHKAISIINN